MKRVLKILLLLLVVVAVIAGVLVWRWFNPPVLDVRDEAMLVDRQASSFPAADEDYFREMDQMAMPGGQIAALALTPEEAKGRNTWNVWTGGNDRMWDELSITSFGALDLLKTLSTYQGSLPNGRHNRWEYLGLVNEPCFAAATTSDPDYRWGLRLDRRRNDCPADPFENESKYPGVKTGSRGTTLRWRGKDITFPVGSYYGYASGIVGLRLFPNPAFDQAAADKWDPERYYKDPSYYNTRNVIKPYRVAMSCGFCHIGPNPLNPPADPEAPAWANLSSNVGAQYFWVDRVLYWRTKPDDFAYQLFHSSRPGTLDTSFISTDNINNPRSMNAVYRLGPRLMQALRGGKEALSGGGLDNRQFNQTIQSGPLTRFFRSPDTVWTPRVLKDGADSVGALGALNRVYLNIGLFSEEWLRHFNPLVGGKPVTPITIQTARNKSAYFKATEAQTLDMARFFLRTTDPHLLKDAPGGAAYLNASSADLTRGKVVFAHTCARCHSSKTPEPAPPILQDGGCAGKEYLECWNSYWKLSNTEEFKKKMEAIVLAPDFLQDNYLSTELRVPVTLLETNACSPLATNALGGNIWDNFSSQSYKDLPSVGEITWYHPITGEARKYRMPAGGRGFTRPPSLLSLWSTAPFLLNNTVGPFEPSPSVEARMRSFQASIEQMLWPERRQKDSRLADKIQGPSLIDRVGDGLRPTELAQWKDKPAYLFAGTGFLPDYLHSKVGIGARLAPRFFNDDGIRVGPIPPGTPIGLISNLDLLGEHANASERHAHEARVFQLAGRMLKGPLDLGGQSEDSRQTIDLLLQLNKCPDLVVNRGHYFGRDLSDPDKRALIEFLKTF